MRYSGFLHVNRLVVCSHSSFLERFTKRRLKTDVVGTAAQKDDNKGTYVSMTRPRYVFRTCTVLDRKDTFSDHLASVGTCKNYIPSTLAVQRGQKNDAPII